jgi:uncharacterized protein
VEEHTVAIGIINHVEFPADDLERAKRFYSAVAGWEFGEMEGFPDYWYFQTSDEQGGGLGTRGQSVSKVVRAYINVASLEAAVAAAEANGGSVITPPTDVPGQGRFAAVNDSEGNEIGLWETVSA